MELSQTVIFLAFLSETAVPFSNNQAEQALRMMKVQQKISGTFCTLKDAQQFAPIRSYLSMVRKHRHHILTAITHALNGQPFWPYVSQ